MHNRVLAITVLMTPSRVPEHSRWRPGADTTETWFLAQTHIRTRGYSARVTATQWSRSDHTQKTTLHRNTHLFRIGRKALKVTTQPRGQRTRTLPGMKQFTLPKKCDQGWCTESGWAAQRKGGWNSHAPKGSKLGGFQGLGSVKGKQTVSHQGCAWGDYLGAECDSSLVLLA